MRIKRSDLSILIIIIGESTFHSTLGQSSACTTDSGPYPGRRCIFPFEFDGRTFRACTEHGDPSRRKWCSVETNADGIHVNGRWGFCPSSCGEGGKIRENECVTVGGNKSGRECVFPFTNNGKKYEGCTLDDADDGVYWCSTLVTSNIVHVKGTQNPKPSFYSH